MIHRALCIRSHQETCLKFNGSKMSHLLGHDICISNELYAFCTHMQITEAFMLWKSVWAVLYLKGLTVVMKRSCSAHINKQFHKQQLLKKQENINMIIAVVINLWTIILECIKDRAAWKVYYWPDTYWQVSLHSRLKCLWKTICTVTHLSY